MVKACLVCLLVVLRLAEGVKTFVVKAVILSYRRLVLSDTLNCTELLNLKFPLGASLFYRENVVNKCSLCMGTGKPVKLLPFVLNDYTLT